MTKKNMHITSDKLVERHRGEILENMVRKGPYPIKTVAQKLGISRTTLYNKFKEYNLDYEFLLSVSDMLHYNIKAEIPELDTKVVLSVNQHNYRARIIDKKYTELLERYKRLFAFLTRIIHQYGIEHIKKPLDKVVGKDIF